MLAHITSVWKVVGQHALAGRHGAILQRCSIKFKWHTFKVAIHIIIKHNSIENQYKCISRNYPFYNGTPPCAMYAIMGNNVYIMCRHCSPMSNMNAVTGNIKLYYIYPVILCTSRLIIITLSVSA